MSVLQTMSFLSNDTQRVNHLQIFSMVKRLRREQIKHSENLQDLKDALLEIKSQVRCQITILDLFDQNNRQQSCLLFVKDLCTQFRMKEINKKLLLTSLKSIKKIIFLCFKSKRQQQKINKSLEEISQELKQTKESLDINDLQHLRQMMQKMLERRLKFKYMFLERNDLREKIFDLQTENAKLKTQLPQKHSHQLEALLKILRDDSVRKDTEVKIQEPELPELEQQVQPVGPMKIEEPTYMYYPIYYVPYLPYWPQQYGYQE